MEATSEERVLALHSALSDMVCSGHTSTTKLLRSASADCCSFVARNLASQAEGSQTLLFGCADMRVDIVAGAPQTGQVLGNRILLIFALTIGSSKQSLCPFVVKSHITRPEEQI